MAQRCVSCIIFIVLFCYRINKVHGEDGVIYSRPSTSTVDWGDHFCISFDPQFHPLPEEKSQARVYSLVHLSSDHGCFNSSAYTNNTKVKDSLVGVARGDCTFSEKAMMAQRYGAAGILIVSTQKVYPRANQTSDYDTVKVIVASISETDYADILRDGPSIEVIMISPKISRFDPCTIVIFLLAMFCISLGGYWAGTSSAQGVKKPKSSSKKSASSGEDDRNDDAEDEDELDITIPKVIVFFIMVCAFLVLLYFFYEYLVYVVIGLFCLAGTVGLYSCLEPLWDRIPWTSSVPENRIPILSQRPLYRNIVLGLLCMGVGIFWGVQRNESYAWVIQDILGAAFCVNILKTLKLPNLKICVVLMVLLFFYDIFFVFITPYITSSGESIMVKVATGGSSSGSSSGEQIPMVFKVPRLGSSPMKVCSLPYSLLGFGDIIVPGLLVSYNYRFDVRTGGRCLYFVSTVIAYGLGLVVTFCALYLMEKGQPALLYLVPFTLITTFVIGCIRGEAGALWSGVTKQEIYKKNDSSSPNTIQAGGSDGTAKPDDQSSSCSSSSAGSESELLRKK